MPDMNRIWDFKAFGDRTAFLDDTGVSVSYDELAALQDRLSETSGCGKLTMMLCENSIGALSGYAALLNSGHPMFMLSSAVSPEMRRHIMNTYRPGLVFAPRSLRSDFLHMQELAAVDDYILFKTSFSDAYPVNPLLGQMLSTSGSTGSVKFVRQSFENIRCNGQYINDYLNITGSERTITALPMNYTYGLSVICSSLLAGAEMIVTRKGIMDEEFWDLFENEHITAFHGVPATYGMLYRLNIFCEDFPDLRLMTQAGGKLGRELQLFYAGYAGDYNKRFVIMYGQSEATAAISYLPADKALEKPGSAGIVVKDGKIELADAEGNIVNEPHVQGEVIYYGKNVTLGYAVRGEDLIKGDELNGRLKTGDLAERDEDGFLYITGRLSRFIKISGHRISLDEIDERVLDDIHIRCVSSGTDDHLIIFVLSDEDKDAVQDYLIKNMGIVRPRLRIVKIDAFPENEGGKILYGVLSEMSEKYIE